MKICIISNGDAFDKKTWSGTPTNIATRLATYDDVEVVSLNLKQLLRRPISSKIESVLGKLVYIKGSPRDPHRYKHDTHIIGQELQKIGADVNLFCAEYCVGENFGRSKNYSYIDATLRPLLEADSRRKLFQESFLAAYEKNEKKCYQLLDGIFTMNDWSIDSANQIYGVSKNKFTNVGFGINAQYYEGAKDYSNKHALIILRKGTEYYKGLDLLLEAFVECKKNNPDMILSVVGTDYKKVDGVTYYYNQPREVTLQLLRDASLYIMPSVREPNGITYLEALANKTPIIGLERFAFPEFSGNGEYGFIVKEYDAKLLADTILHAFSNPSRLKDMGEKGQKFVKKKYDWDSVVGKMMEVFTKD